MEQGKMNGTKVSRRSVYENEQKIRDSGAIPQLASSVDDLGKIKSEKVPRISTANMLVLPGIEAGRDQSKKITLPIEERIKQATLPPITLIQNESYQPNCPQGNNLPSRETSDRQPVNFGVVAPGIFRSSFPLSENFHYLESLGLKTILSLVKKDFTPEFLEFVKRNAINHKIIDMTGTKKIDISEAMMKDIMSIVLDQSNHPIMIHCNRGKHRTGCAVAAIRHVSGWDCMKIVQEYRDFAAPKIRDSDIKYISNFKVSILGNILIQTPKIRSHVLGINLKVWRMLFLSVSLIFMFMTLRCHPKMGLNSK